MNKNITVSAIYKQLNNPTIPMRFYRNEYIEPIRRAKIILLFTCLHGYEIFAKLNEEERSDIIEELEKSIYAYSVEQVKLSGLTPDWSNMKFNNIYHSCCAKIASNIDFNGSIKNIKLAYSIIKKEIEFTHIPYMTSIELMPEKHSDILENIDKIKNVTTNLNS